MANAPLLFARVTITTKDINGNNILKTFNNVQAINFDYVKGQVNVVDSTGSFYFQLSALTTLTYTIVGGLNGQHSIVAS